MFLVATITTSSSPSDLDTDTNDLFLPTMSISSGSDGDQVDCKKSHRSSSPFSDCKEVRFAQTGHQLRFASEWHSWEDQDSDVEDLGRQLVLAWHGEVSEGSDTITDSSSPRTDCGFPPHDPDTMTNAWSSAATGKPQLSYAERLRRAKVSSQPAEQNGSPAEKAVTVNGQGATDHRGADETSKSATQGKLMHPAASTSGESSNHHASTSMSPSLSSHETGDTSSPAVSTSNSPTLLHAKAQPVASETVNVWEARRRQMQEKAKLQKETDSIERSAESPEKAEANGADARSTVERLHDVTPKTQSPTEPKAERVERPAHIPTDPSANYVRSDSHHNGRPSVNKQSKGQRRKHNTATSSASEVNGARTSHSQPPPVTDNVSWPSPVMAKGKTQRLSEGSGMPSTAAPDRGRSSLAVDEDHDTNRNVAREDDSSLSRTSTSGLEGLDVQILAHAGSDRPRKGKQWIPIVPNVTHNTPPPPKQRRNKGTPPKWQRPNHSRQHSGASLGLNNDRRVSSNPESRQERHSPASISSGADRAHSVRGSPRTALNGLLASDRAEPSTSSSPRGMATSISNGLPILPRSPGNSSHRAQPLLDFSVGGLMSPQAYGAPLVLGDGSFAPGTLTAQRSGARTPRGARGRGGSKRTESSANTDEGSPKPSEEFGDVQDGKFVASGADQIWPNPIPVGPRRASEAQGRPQTYGQPAFSVPPRQRPHAAPYLASNGISQMHAANPTGMYPVLCFMESTPAEFAPNGTSTSTEPTPVLLSQIEYYFSQQNLQGDFFLRQNMDSQGFVGLGTVASFNRVKRLVGEENVEVILQTLRFSKVLQLSEDDSKVRKAFGWEPFVLTAGGHPQQIAYPHAVPFMNMSGGNFSPPPMHLSEFGPVHTGYPTFNGYVPMQDLDSQSNYNAAQGPPAMNSYAYSRRQQRPPRRDSTTSSQSYRTRSGPPPRQSGPRPPRGPSQNAAPVNARGSTVQSQSSPASQKESVANRDSQQEDGLDNEDDMSLGIVAAAGLAASTKKGANQRT